MKARQILVAAGVAGLLLLLAWVLGQGLSGLNIDTSPPQPNLPESATDEPFPEIHPAPDLAARRAYWMRLLLSGDLEDAHYAQIQLRRDGAPGRAAVVAAAQRGQRSNTALLQHALIFLREDARPDCLPIAREALASRDFHAATRAAELLGALGPIADDASRDLADAAVEREDTVAQAATIALARIATPAARAAAMDAAVRMDARRRGHALAALGQIGGEKSRAFLRERFTAETDPLPRLGAAEGLLRMDDRTPVPWMLEEAARRDGNAFVGATALRLLAKAGIVEALPRLVQRARDRFEDDGVRAGAVELLRAYELADVEPVLRDAAASDAPRDTRLAALQLLVEKDAPGALAHVEELLSSPGDSGRRDRLVGALVLGRLRRPETAPALLHALEVERADDEELISFLLRALILSGAPEGAEAVARRFAADTTPYGLGGVSFNTGPVLSEMTPEFRSALCREITRALRGEFGEPERSGLAALITSVPAACGREGAPLVEGYLLHAEREIRDAALDALTTVARPESLAVLRRAWARPQDAGARVVLRDVIEKVQFGAE